MHLFYGVGGKRVDGLEGRPFADDNLERWAGIEEPYGLGGNLA